MSCSSQTKKYRIGYWILTVISWMLVFGPLAGYFIYGLIVSGTIQKAGLLTTLLVAVVLTAVSAIMKLHLRSALFILVLGIYLAIDKISLLLIIISVCSVLDELLISPLQRSFKAKLTINKQIDKREEKREENGQS